MRVMILLITIEQEVRMWLLSPGFPSYGFPLPAFQQPALAAAVVLPPCCDCGASPPWRLGSWSCGPRSSAGGATYIWATREAYLFVPLVLELIALAVSPGPRRGLQILTWKLGTFAVIATLAVAMTGYWG